MVRRALAPAPSRTPPVVTLPGSTIMMFEPRLLIWSSTSARAPAPIATIAITAATPMKMPSMVSALRSGLARSACSADRKASP